MNTIKQGILMAASAFIFLTLFSNFMDGRIDWISSFGVASGFLLGSILMYLWQRDGKKQRM
jgi:membrane associated rhomboid family serine protease